MLKATFILLSFLIIFIRTTVCWEAILERYKINYLETSKVNGTGLIFRYNRTNIAANVDFDVFEDVPAQALIIIKLYGLYSNKYTELPLKLKRKICDIFKYEFQWIKNDIIGSFPERCPIKKGHYYIRNYIPNVKLFPAKPWDTNNYMIELKIFSNNKVVVWIEVFVRTTTNDELFKG